MATQKNILDSEGLKHLLSQLHERQVWDKGLSELDFTQALKDTYDSKPSYEKTTTTPYNPPSYTEEGDFINPKTKKVIYPHTKLSRVVDFPKGTKKGQVLTYDGTNPVWADTLNDEVMLNSLTYGIAWNFAEHGSDPLNLTRLGSPELHKNLPVHNQFRGCIYQPDLTTGTGGKFIKWLNPSDWTKRGPYYSGDDFIYGPQSTALLEKGDVRFKFWFGRDVERDRGFEETWIYNNTRLTHHYPIIYDSEKFNTEYKSSEVGGGTINFPSKYDGKLCITQLEYAAFFMLQKGGIPIPSPGKRMSTDLNPVALKGMDITFVMKNNSARYTYKVLDVILSCNGDVVYDPTIHANPLNKAATYPITIVLDVNPVSGTQEYTDLISSNVEYFLVEECLNGYYGQIKVLTPDFYIQSKEIRPSWGVPGMAGEVRVSNFKIEGWEHQPSLYLDAYKATILNEVPENMGYLSTLEVGTAVSIANNSVYCRGGDNTDANDPSTDIFKSNLGKCRTDIDLLQARASAGYGGQTLMTFNQYKNLTWLWVIEYASFKTTDDFNPELTPEGYHSGGMGQGCTGFDTSKLYTYNGGNPIIPNGYTNDIGNGTGIKSISVPLTSSETFETTAIRWRGIENIFGDTGTIIDGISAIVNRKVIQDGTNTNNKYLSVNFYTSDDPRIYVGGTIKESGDFAGQAKFYRASADGSFMGTHRINLGSKAGFIPLVADSSTRPYEYYCFPVYFASSTSGPTEPPISMGASSVSYSYGNGIMVMNLVETSTYNGFRTVCLGPTEDYSNTLEPIAPPQ